VLNHGIRPVIILDLIVSHDMKERGRDAQPFGFI
jgi:hypothetical protein